MRECAFEVSKMRPGQVLRWPCDGITEPQFDSPKVGIVAAR